MSWRRKWRRHLIYVVLGTLTTWAIGLGTLYLSYRAFEPAEQAWLLERLPRVVPFLVAGGAFFGLLMHSLSAQVYHLYILPLLKLADQTRWIHQGLGARQVEPEGAPEARALAQVINEYAAEQAYLNKWGHSERGQLAQEEGHVLAALFCADRRGHLLLGPQGRVLLYNERAKQLIPELQLGRRYLNKDAPQPLDRLELPQPQGAPWVWLKLGLSVPLKDPANCEAGPLAFAPAFAQLPEEPALWGDLPLYDLSYCALDTETTGLNPSQGDRIIELGAMRLTGRRLLEWETFLEQFDPGRPVSKASTEVHGLTDQDLIGQAKLSEHWPVFLEFAERSVWLAHNAAFDLACFQAELGYQPEVPVLDTLCLAEFCLGGHWSLEDLSKRFGIELKDRHRALGDARLAGLVFLRLVPLLEKQGIKTLSQAVELTQNHQLSALKY